MKHIFSFLLCIVFFTQLSFGQSVPQGMKYQAVARDVKGQVMADQTIYIKITLYSDPVRRDVSYIELHKVVTNPIGLFDMTIGGGQPIAGTFDKVPWSNEEVWIEVALQTNDSQDYLTISNSRMLSVPYAFHAATASEIVNIQRNSNGPGIPSQTWSLFGNSNSDPSKDKLGTTDNVDLVIVTNNIERIRVLANGNVDIDRSLHIGEDLTVDRNTYLNVLSGETINYGDFTVENESSTLLSGTLTVDLATDLNSSLNVDGITNLNSSLFVNNMASSVLTGTLRVDKDAVFKQHVLLDNGALGSTLPTNGALVVNGGVGIGENLNVAGASKFGGPVEFAGAVSITDLTESTGLGTGALKVSGGVSIGKRLNVGGATGLLSTLSVTGATTLNNTLAVSGITSLNNILESTGTTSGSLVVAGGVGIAKNLNVGGSTVLNKELTVKGTGVLGGHVASFENTTNGSGIMVKIGAGAPTNANNFVTFMNSGGGVVGRIEGESSASDLAANFEYQEKLFTLDYDVAFATVEVAAATLEEIQGAVTLVGASTSTTVCVGLGACVTAPVPSLIVAAVAGLVVNTANLVAKGIQLGVAVDNKINFESDYAAQIGVTYASGAGDYAEYLPKVNPAENFGPGDVVGLKHGFISKNTKDAERIMVISFNPIVLGKLPADGNEENYEMVAFLGQIPTKVMGVVHQGDYILSSGYHNGFGIARNPKNMLIDDYSRILGVAWEEALENKLNMVNVAVGLNTNDMTGVIRQQAELINDQNEKLQQLNDQVAQTQDILAKLLPGFKESLGDHEVIATGTTRNEDHASDNHTAEAHALESKSEDIIYFDVTRDQLEEGIAMAQDLSIKAGANMETHPFWNRLKTDPSYKNEILADLKNKVDAAFHTHKHLNENK